ERPGVRAEPIGHRGRGRRASARDDDMLAPARKQVYRSREQRVPAELGQRLVAAKARGLPAGENAAEDHALDSRFAHLLTSSGRAALWLTARDLITLPLFPKLSPPWRDRTKNPQAST